MGAHERKTPPAPPLSVAILAGGKNSRMGKNKALLTYDGKTFLERLVSEFSCFDEILVSAKDDSVMRDLIHHLEVSKQVQKDGLQVRTDNFIKIVPDENQDRGPLEGLRQVLSEARNDFVFVCACDMPFATKKIPDWLQEFFSSDYQIFVPTLGGKPEPLCAVYKKSIIPAVEKRLAENELKLSRLFESVPTKFIPVEKSALEEKYFLNVNTPEEYRALAKPFVFCVSGLKNSGKTRMVLSLIDEFKKRGKTVGVIKHDGHDCFTDAPNTDTAFFSERGAVCTAIFSDSRFAFHGFDSVCAETLVEKMKQLPAPPDVIIIEGLKDSAYPKVEVLRRGVSEKSVCGRETLMCTASDFPFDGAEGIPNFSSDAPGKICSCISEYGFV